MERSIDRLAEAAGPVDAIGIDMPIHLNETSDRVCDSAARRLMRPFSSCVFNAPVLSVLDCETYLDAWRGFVRGSGQEDLEADMGARPEDPRGRGLASFGGLHGLRSASGGRVRGDGRRGGRSAKRTSEGAQVRRALLSAQGLTAPVWPSGAGVDDLLDAPRGGVVDGTSGARRRSLIARSASDRARPTASDLVLEPVTRREIEVPEAERVDPRRARRRCRTRGRTRR